MPSILVKYFTAVISILLSSEKIAMKFFFKIALVSAFFLNFSTLRAQEQPQEFDPNFTHVVYFWLENPDNAEDRQAFLVSLEKLLETSKYAKTKFIGKSAGSSRNVVDGSFTFSLILTFPSREAEENYQKEEAHLKFIEESEHLWKKVIVYDSLDTSSEE